MSVDHSTFVFNNAAPQAMLILGVVWLLVSLLMTPAKRKPAKASPATVTYTETDTDEEGVRP